MTLQTLPSLSQARGQIQGSQVWLCTAHARPTPAATQRGDPYPKKPEFFPLTASKTWEAAGKSSATPSPVKRHILPLLDTFTKPAPYPIPGAAGGTPGTFTTLQIRAGLCLGARVGHVCPGSALAMEVSAQGYYSLLRKLT